VDEDFCVHVLDTCKSRVYHVDSDQSLIGRDVIHTYVISPPGAL
jgi:hypothetical protein